MQNVEIANQSINTSGVVIGPHSATTSVLRSMLNREIQSSIGYRSSISVECEDGVVTLSGYFANRNDKHTALRKAIAIPGVCRIVNNAN